MRAWLAIYAKGFCMGAADMVPGVSGGTIALIVGIYERLVRAIAAIRPTLLFDLPKIGDPDVRRDLRAALRSMDLAFLIVLGLGVATAALVMSQLILAVFVAYPAQLNALFFGLIGGSAVVLGRQIPLANGRRLAVGAAGAALAFFVTGTDQLLGAERLPLVFLAGAIAISAMILPGISGAAFLYILGQYEYLLGELRRLMEAVVGLVIDGSTAAVVDPGIVVGTFLAGAAVGLLTMARIVSWALSRFRMATLAFLVGLMVGALRLPVIEIRATLGWPTPLESASLAAAAVLGIGAVVLLDWYTETLEYTDPPA